MELARNSFKHAIAEGRVQIGLWSSLCSNIGAEVVADAGFDWILLDGEHSPNDVLSTMSQLQALNGGTASPIVRPAWNDAVMVERILDIGAQSILVPYVQNAEEAERMVRDLDAEHPDVLGDEHVVEAQERKRARKGRLRAMAEEQPLGITQMASEAPVRGRVRDRVEISAE